MKIVLIGAGSVSFGPGMLADAVHTPEVRGAELTLVDVDGSAVEMMAALARRMNDQAGAGLRISQTGDLDEALSGADFVIIAVEVNRIELWRQDFRVPLKHGIKQVMGENGGPGGLFHTLRIVPVIIDICRRIEKHCSNALVLSFTNPVARVRLAITRYADVRAVGLCHGIGMAINSAARIMGVDADDIQVTAAGFNHFTWLLDLRSKSTGSDLYPLLREKSKTFDPTYLPLTRRMLDVFGLYPSPSDDHIGEYLPFAWEYCGLEGYDFDSAERRSADLRARIERAARGEEDAGAFVERRSGERAFDIIAAVAADKNSLELAVNVPNDGHIPNLPSGATVEIPAIVNSKGVIGKEVGPLPDGIAALCAPQLAVQELAVRAAVTGDRKIALQALLADPVVQSAEAAEKTLDELASLQARYLSLS